MLQADFVACEPHFGRADQAAGVVDQPHRPNGAAWSRSAANLQPFEQIDEFTSSAVVRLSA